jgi:hypothetical protein
MLREDVMKFNARKSLECLAIIGIIFLPPFFITSAIIFPITSNESFLKSAIATSTLVAERALIPQNVITNQFQTQIDKSDQIGVINFSALARYNTTIVNNIYLASQIGSGTISWRPMYVTTTLICASQTIPFGIPITIASDTGINDTENILSAFACTSVSFPNGINGVGFLRFPDSELILQAKAPLTSTPTNSSYFWIFLIVLGIWAGIIIALKEMIHFIKAGFKYLWN